MIQDVEPLRADIHRWLQLYDLEDYLFDTVSGRYLANGTLTAYDFFAIVSWKSNRTKTKVRDGLAEIDKSVDGLMREVYEAHTPAERVDRLLNVRGIGIPIASAILAVCYPTEFTVLDWRAWETLKECEAEGLPPRYPWTSQEYVQYCLACKLLAEQVGLSLRDLDRALWGRSWEKGALEFCEGL